MSLDQFTHKVTLPKKYGSREVEWIEYPFRSRLMPNGYWVTLAAIVIPARAHPQDVLTIAVGGSACSPEDAHVFSRQDASNRALGRARQLAGKLLAGAVDPNRLTLVGPESDCVFEIAGDNPALFATLERAVQPLYERVARAAEDTSLQDLVRWLRKQYPDHIIEARWSIK